MITNFHNQKNSEKNPTVQVFIDDNSRLLLKQIKSIILKYF